MAARFNEPGNELINHYTYAMCGDGDLMEGVTNEAVSLAGHLGLGKLILIYDDNDISIEGKTDITFTENVKARFEAMNWHVVEVEDGNDIEKIKSSIQAGQNETEKPTLIKLTTHIAYGSPAKQDSADAHGAPLGPDEVKAVKKFFNVPENKDFYVPEKVLETCRHAVDTGIHMEEKWQKVFQAYKTEFPEKADQFIDAISGFLTKGWDAEIPVFKPSDPAVATRAASGKVLNQIAKNLPFLMGGSADLAPSNKTYMETSADFQKNAYINTNIRFGVREHAMASIMSGMYLHSGVRPFGGTFLVFADYMRPAIRVATLMKLPLIYVFTHDSVAVGEDGPTHQPVEHLASLRAIPGLNVVRPADAVETSDAWQQALKTLDSPTALILSRQKLPILDHTHTDGSLKYGAYILNKTKTQPDIILMASGSEVHICAEAAADLEQKGIHARVLSMPSWELFEKATPSYKKRMLPPEIKKRMAVEAGISMGWEKYTGDKGKIISIDSFGTSAPGGTVLAEYGFTKDRIVSEALEMMEH